MFALGLFGGNMLIGMALPAIHPVRELKFLDVGDIYVLPGHASDGAAFRISAVIRLWNAATHYALENGCIPAAFRISEQNPTMNGKFARSAGYTCTSRLISVQLGESN